MKRTLFYSICSLACLALSACGSESPPQPLVYPGRVQGAVSSGGAALAGATVILRHSGERDTVITGPDGWYSFDRPDGELWLEAHPPGFGFSWEQDVDSEVRVDFPFASATLEATAPPSVRGLNATLRWSYYSSSVIIQSVLSERVVRFPTIHLRPGQYQAGLRLGEVPPYEWMYHSVIEAEPNGRVVLAHEFGELSRLRVRLVPPGWNHFFFSLPRVSWAATELQPEDDGIEADFVGSYPGSVDTGVRISVSGGARVFPLLVQAGEAREVEYAVGGIRLRIFGMGTETAQGSVRFMNSVGEVAAEQDFYFDGSETPFEFVQPWLPPDRYRIWIGNERLDRARGWSDQWYPGTYPADDAVELVLENEGSRVVRDFILAPAGDIELRLILHDGASPPRKGRLIAFDSRADHSFEIDEPFVRLYGVPPGKYLLVACDSFERCISYPYSAPPEHGGLVEVLPGKPLEGEWHVRPPFLPDLGTCCHPDGSCSILPTEECVQSGGIVTGYGEACSPATCESELVGACCLPSGCTLLSESACVAQLGRFYGYASCGDVRCLPSRFGACCLPDGDCTILSEPHCDAANGAFLGRTPCPAGPCETYGACCDSRSGECALLSESLCRALGSAAEFQGRGTSCDPNLCPVPGSN
jgi:hypothetical protein